uniref:Protein dcd1A-like n=1 Tax=Saccoglossus kowalevskii TaxID=10224 RepID=A0ABM0MUT5_SACKO|nr:PREDICTED: protein dcd1A-like [Saccoglossus kowalevskii]
MLRTPILVSLCMAIAFVCCYSKPDPHAKSNLNPLQTDPPTFVKQIKNAKLYTVGKGDDVINVLHLWGTPYEKGYAHGTILKDEASAMMDEAWNYFEQEIIDAVNKTIPGFFQPWFLKDVANLGLEAALELEIAATKPFTPSYFYEEMKGLSDGARIDVKKLERIHMFGELTKGSCSMYGAWGDALPFPGAVMQLRALDWASGGPLQNYPQITVYHIDETNSTNGHAFANVGWSGWIGSITGMSSKQMAISEIGVYFSDDSFGEESRFGIPFTFILRDILQFDNTLDDALNRIANARRTCDLILGVGDAKLETFRGIEYSSGVADFFDDMNIRPEAAWHPKIRHVVYWGMDWIDPDYSSVLGRQLQKYHGNITAENTIRDVVSIVQTGDLHIAVYDLTRNYMFVANARKKGASGPVMAYDRPFIRLSMAALFKEAKPQI